MRQPSTSHRALRFAFAAALLAPLVIWGLGAGCGPDQNLVWICLNNVTGKLENGSYDPNHYVNGLFDPCHCYDPCGPEKSCPMTVDAGPPPLGCDAGNAGP